MYNMRMTSQSELSDKLRHLSKFEVDVSILNNSNFMPEYVETKDGVEIYTHAGKQVEVQPGHVIDSHGNVVNMEGLNRQKNIEISKPIGLDSGSRDERYKDISIEPIPSQNSPRSDIMARYANIGKPEKKDPFGLGLPSDRPTDTKYDLTTLFK